MSYNPSVSPSSFQFGANAQVPAGGTLQLLGPDQTSSGFVLINDGKIVGASLGVVGTSGNNYDMEIRVNTVTVATLSLTAGTSEAYGSLSISVVAGDSITVFMVRTSGSGGSTFQNQQAIVQVSNMSNVT